MGVQSLGSKIASLELASDLSQAERARKGGMEGIRGIALEGMAVTI